jgi:hypothetical protein
MGFSSGCRGLGNGTAQPRAQASAPELEKLIAPGLFMQRLATGENSLPTFGRSRYGVLK